MKKYVKSAWWGDDEDEIDKGLSLSLKLLMATRPGDRSFSVQRVVDGNTVKFNVDGVGMDDDRWIWDFSEFDGMDAEEIADTIATRIANDAGLAYP